MTPRCRICVLNISLIFKQYTWCPFSKYILCYSFVTLLKYTIVSYKFLSAIQFYSFVCICLLYIFCKQINKLIIKFFCVYQVIYLYYHAISFLVKHFYLTKILFSYLHNFRRFSFKSTLSFCLQGVPWRYGHSWKTCCQSTFKLKMHLINVRFKLNRFATSGKPSKKRCCQDNFKST